MKPAPISLVEYFVSDLALTASRQFNVSKGVEFKPTEFGTDVSASRMEGDSRKWQLRLEVKHQASPETNFPYAFKVGLIGFFQVSDSVAVEQEERTVKIHGASVLYGVAREVVRAMTGRGPHRAVMIPTVSFYEQAPVKPELKALSDT